MTTTLSVTVFFSPSPLAPGVLITVCNNYASYSRPDGADFELLRHDECMKNLCQNLGALTSRFCS